MHRARSNSSGSTTVLDPRPIRSNQGLPPTDRPRGLSLTQRTNSLSPPKPRAPSLGRGEIKQVDSDGSPTSNSGSPLNGSPTWGRRSTTSSENGGSTPKFSRNQFVPSSGGLAASLTQVQQTPKRSDSLPSIINTGNLDKSNTPSTPESSGKVVMSEAVKNRLRKIKSQALNLSPCRGIVEPMLPAPTSDKAKKMMLVLDIDETLVHASFTPDAHYDTKVTITVGGETGHIYVAYRPHLKTFLAAVAPLFEIAVFTASQSCYASQLMDTIDPQRKLGSHRLFREHCTEVNGARVKDLSLLGRPLERMVIIDNSPVAYLFQPRNAIPILSWFDDPNDTELLKLIPMLKQLANEPKVYDLLDDYNAGAITF